MSHPGNKVDIQVDGNTTYQTLDGFGVNINARYWGPDLLPAMELLLNDLGATLYRVDIWGKSNWIDPEGKLGRAALDPDHQAGILRGDAFQRGWAMMRWLNEHGIQPYLTASGIVPPWMLGPDGRTLVDFEAFAEMMACMLEWAKRQEKLDFILFGPLNETDIGPPEGPALTPQGFVQACEALNEKLSARGLDDILLVVAEQGGFNRDYLSALIASPALRQRIGVFALHDYWDIPQALYQEVAGAVKSSPCADKPLWMTEFGDLEQSGEREWYVAWAMVSRLFDHLEAGFSASLVWDAFDNYHDHDEAWTIYGLLRTGLRLHTPKKRYYAMKQVFRFARPGFQRIAVECDEPQVRACAFASPDRAQFTLCGMNRGALPARLNVELAGFPPAMLATRLAYYRTSEQENCVQVETIPARGHAWPFNGIDALIPPGSIFTLTTIED